MNLSQKLASLYDKLRGKQRPDLAEAVERVGSAIERIIQERKDNQK